MIRPPGNRRGSGRRWQPVTLLAAALVAGCGGAASGRAAPPDAVAVPSAAGASPLPLGFYVASDTPCGEASNATLALLHRDGLNGARDFCRFAALERTGPATFRATERCATVGSGDEWSMVVDWEILGPSSFRRTRDDGWVSEFRFCEQSSLPGPWRETDISDIIETADGDRP